MPFQNVQVFKSFHKILRIVHPCATSGRNSYEHAHDGYFYDRLSGGSHFVALRIKPLGRFAKFDRQVFDASGKNRDGKPNFADRRFSGGVTGKIHKFIIQRVRNEFFRGLSKKSEYGPGGPARPITTLLRSLYLQNYASDLHVVFTEW